MRRLQLVCIGLVVLAGCGVAVTGPAPSSTPTEPLPAPMPDPTLFGEGVISTGEYESHPAFTPDGRTLYFVRSTSEFTDWTIYVSELTDGRWSPPTVAPFSGKHRDADPFVSADGQQLYFISDRPVDGKPREDMDIPMGERPNRPGNGLRGSARWT
jgi:hypothetical protein